MTSRKCRSTKDLKRVFVGDKPPCGSSSGWDKCGDGFTDASLLKNIKSTGKKLSAVRTLMQLSTSDRSNEDAVDITWSSDSSQSDSELRNQHGTSTAKTSHVQSYCRALHSVITGEDDLPTIDTDSDISRSEDDDKDRGPQISDCDSEDKPEFSCPDPTTLQELEISPYESDGENINDSSTWKRRDWFSARAGEGSKRSVSDWVRSAHALLQTPQKSREAPCRTPEDSAKKRRTFQSGGLADRLNRLQRRQKSAISFWRHQSICDSPTRVDRPGVLVLKVLECQQECSMQVVHCERHQSPEEGHQHNDPRSEDARVLVLFNRDTATQLSPAPGDVVVVHPPWQNLSVHSFGCNVILNTHFSQKVFCASKAVDQASSPGRAESRPCSLCRTFGLLQVCSSSAGNAPQQVAPEALSGFDDLASWTRHSSSLLEVIERLGQGGSVGQDVVVTVQRVYSTPVPACSPLSTLKSKLPSRSSPAPAETYKTRLCLLVQDGYGMFSVVQLHVLPSQDDLWRYCQVWQGKTCVLKGIKVVQRVTRDRSTRLFSLIDSLWPPVMPPKCHGNTQSTSSTLTSAPSFCYLLSGQESSVKPTERSADSPIFFPPKTQTLQELLQMEMKTLRCSFTALVVYKRIQSDVGHGEVWLVLTDSSLQEESSERPRRRTVAMCVRTSCVLTSCVLKALNSPSGCCLTVRDAIKEHGVLLCAEQSIIESCEGVEPEGRPESLSEPLPRPVRLDPLGLEITANSLCTLSGVIVGVDESTAHSWPACVHCGGNSLEWTQPQSFTCSSCKSAVDKPATKLQLEVYLSCAQLKNCTIKVKLQHHTISSVLDAAALQAQEFPGYHVQSILGKEVGPLTAFVRVVTRRPSLWVGLEEISL